MTKSINYKSKLRKKKQIKYRNLKGRGETEDDKTLTTLIARISRSKYTRKEQAEIIMRWRQHLRLVFSHL